MIGQTKQVWHALAWLCAGIALLTHVPVMAQTVEYLHTDLLGSPLQRSNQSGVVTADNRFSAFGAALSASGTPAPIGYTGAATDPESGFVYLHNRYYDPRVGRFLGKDPVDFYEANPQSFNLYSYSTNNPYRYTDPDGRNVFAILDWKDFASDSGQLLVDEIVYGIAVANDNDAVAQMAIEAMIEHRFAAAASTVGVMSPVPKSGQGIKRAANAMEMVGEARAAARRANSNPSRGRFDGEHIGPRGFDKAVDSARKHAGDLGENTQRMYDPKTGTLIGEKSADGKRGWRMDDDHLNWWDWTGGKKGAGGKYGHEYFPEEQAGPHSEHIGYAPWE